MIIWIALAVPIPLMAVAYWKFQHSITLWEVALMLGVPVLLVGSAKILVEGVQTSDTEYWGGWVTKAEYYEDWNERVSCRHEIPCSHPRYRTDADGNRQFAGYLHANDGDRHPYDVDYHPEYWTLHGSNGETFVIERGTFERLAHQFGNRVFIELNRNYHTDDGDKHVSTWKGEPDHLEPVTTVHSYENRVQASTSVFNFPEVDPKGLYAYPPVDGYRQRCVLGDAGPGAEEGERRIQYLNATLGASRQFRVFVLVFRNRTMQAAFDQKALWKGGNKNELVACVGVDRDHSVQWANVFSWSESELLKAEARDFLAAQETLDLAAFADWLGPAVRDKWVRKPFAEFSYLTVDPPLWTVVLTFILTLLASVGVAAWAVKNDADPGRVCSFEGILERSPR